MNPGKVFKKAREYKGLTLRQTADLLGITKSALWKIEAGKVWPKHTTILDFCGRFDMPVAMFYIESIEWEDYGTR